MIPGQMPGGYAGPGGSGVGPMGGAMPMYGGQVMGMPYGGAAYGMSPYGGMVYGMPPVYMA